MNDADWYFDNITEQVIYGDINDGPEGVAVKRKLKKSILVKKYARNLLFDITALPEPVATAVMQLRNQLSMEAEAS